MKVTFEIEAETVNELNDQLRAICGAKAGAHTCESRISLLKEIKDAARTWVDGNYQPTLQEVRDLVWKHVS